MATQINDSLKSLVTGLGTDRSALYSFEYTTPLPQRDQEYINAFRTSKLARRIVEQPAKDCFRKWRAWQADNIDISLIEKTEKRLDVRGKLEWAKIMANLLGRAYVYISVKGDESRVSEPVNLDRIKRGGINRLVVLTKAEVVEGPIEYDALSERYGEPQYYEVMSAQTLARVHPSRMVVFYGAERPYDFTTGREADSVLTAILPSVKRHEAMVNAVGDLVQEACVDVITVPDLATMAQDPDTLQKIIERFALMKMMKSNNRVTLLSGSVTENLNSETWDQKQVSFATLPDVIKTDQEELAASAQMPRAILFGVSSGGLGSTGDLELSAYYDMINSIQTNDIEPALTTLDEAIIRDALGNRPDDIWYEWRSLWQVSDDEKSKIGNAIADKWKKFVDAGIFPADVVAEAAMNELTESGVGGGIEQAFEEWLAAGGELDLSEEDMDNDDDTAIEE